MRIDDVPSVGKLRGAARSKHRDRRGTRAASSILVFATLLLSPWNTSAAEKRLADTGYVFWDASGELGDIVIVRILPQANDKRIVVALYGELKLQGDANWSPLPVSAAGQEFGYASRRIPGAVQCSMIVFPRGTLPVDVPLQIPAYAYFLPGERFTFRYRIRTLVSAPGKPDAWADDKVIPQTEDVAQRTPAHGKTVVDTQFAPAYSGARAPSAVAQGPIEPRVKKFTLANP